MSTELELKLELDPGNAGSLTKHAFSGKAACGSDHLRSVYYDTSACKLRKNGFTLRVRSTPHGFVQTVKTVDPGAGIFFRGEWEAPVKSLKPHVPDIERTPAGNVGARKFRAVVNSEVDRTVWRTKSNGSLLEFALDEGELRAGGQEAPVCELEIELLKGEPAEVFGAARKIAEFLPVKIGVLSKAERGFALARGDLATPTKAPAVPVRAEMDVAQGFAIIAQSSLRHFRLNEPLVIASRDAAALHQARVAMRRLRSALSLFRPALLDPEFARLRQELRWFTSQLGGARNLDVYLEGELPRHVRRTLSRERNRAYDVVIAALNSKRFRLLMIDLVRWISIGDWRSGDKARRHLSEFGVRRIDRLWQKIATHGDLRGLDEKERHQLRIQIKKLRYGLEFLRALHSHTDRKQKQFLRSVEALQETLGHLNDIVTARDFAKAGLPRVADPLLENKLIHQADRRFRRLRKMDSYWS